MGFGYKTKVVLLQIDNERMAISGEETSGYQKEEKRGAWAPSKTQLLHNTVLYYKILLLSLAIIQT